MDREMIALHYDCVVCGENAYALRKDGVAEGHPATGLCEQHAKKVECDYCKRKFKPLDKNFAVLGDTVADAGDCNVVCFECFGEVAECSVCESIFYINSVADDDEDVCSDCREYDFDDPF